MAEKKKIDKSFYDRLAKLLSLSEPFALNANMIVALIREGKFSIITRLAQSKNYVLTQKTASELISLCYSYILEAREIQQVKSFVTLCKKNGRLTRIDTNAIERKLAPLANLLPRKIVVDVVLGDKNSNSFVNELINTYNQWMDYSRERKISSIENSQINTEYRSEKAKLFSKCLNKFEQHLKENNVILNENVKERFESEIQKFLEEITTVFESILSAEMRKGVRVMELLKNIQLRLKLYSTKKYDADINIVSQTIAQGATFSSFDSDVIFLMTLYSAVKAA